jgi:hypothetical protein
MRNKLLIMSTAALLAGTLAAASQSIQPGGGAQDKGRPESSNPGTKSSAGAREQTQGQAERIQDNAKDKQKAKTEGQAQRDQDNLKGKTQGQAERAQDNIKDNAKGKTQGQAERDQDKQKSQTQGQAREQDNKKGPSEGQAQRDQDNLKGKTQTEGQNQRSQDRVREGEQQGSGNAVSFSTEQRTKIRETVFKERNAPRVSKVDFSLNVGTAVPRTVHIVEVPEVIVDIHPEWRGYRYFIVNEEVVIVEPDTLQIVAIIDV